MTRVRAEETEDTADLLESFLAAEGRERRRLFKLLAPRLDTDGVRAIAVAVRDPSPKLCARVTSLLARHGLEEEFQAQLQGLKQGKIDILQRHYAKISGIGSR